MADEQFYWAVKTGDVANVQAAVEKGVNVNAPDQTIKKRTPLHYAADFGQGTLPTSCFIFIQSTSTTAYYKHFSIF
jgi:ankyrin repeat protein